MATNNLYDGEINSLVIPQDVGFTRIWLEEAGINTNGMSKSALCVYACLRLGLKRVSGEDAFRVDDQNWDVVRNSDDILLTIKHRSTGVVWKFEIADDLRPAFETWLNSSAYRV